MGERKGEGMKIGREPSEEKKIREGEGCKEGERRERAEE